MKVFKKILCVFIFVMAISVFIPSVYAEMDNNTNIENIDTKTSINLSNVKNNEYTSDQGDKYKFNISGLESEYTYTGKEIKPNISVEVTKNNEKLDLEYKVSYKDNTKLGVATYYITFDNTDEYEFTNSLNGTFKIIDTKVNLSKLNNDGTYNTAYYKYTFNISVASQTWTGNSIKPTPTIKVTRKPLSGGNEENVDFQYDISYSDNLKVGTAKYTITPKDTNTFEGSITKTFEIKQAKNSSSITISNVSYDKATITVKKVTNASRYTLVITGPNKYKKTINLTDSNLKTTLSSLNKETKYTVKLTVYGKDGDNYYQVMPSITKNFTTKKYTPEKVTISSSKGSNEIAKVSWKACKDVTGYEVYRASGNGSFKKIATVKGKTSYTNYMISAGTYKYKVRSYKVINKKNVYGAYSAAVTVKVKKPTSSTYKLRVNIKTNVTVAYIKDFNGKYKAVKAFATSAGANGQSQPILGTHYTTAKYRWKYMHENCYTQYATRIVGHYLFHSVPYSKTDPSTLWKNSYNKLGSFASAGCIRMNVESSKWIYDHCPLKTRVDVVYSSKDDMKKPKVAKTTNTWDPTDPLYKKK